MERNHPPGSAKGPLGRSWEGITEALSHHPVSVNLYYEDQKREAKRRAKDFRDSRIPKFLGWFERVLAGNPNGDRHLVGDQSARWRK
jgi:hypothetical protein